ncbi:hypothetical protein ES703_82094 [subsurface metagenome]
MEKALKLKTGVILEVDCSTLIPSVAASFGAALLSGIFVESHDRI